MNFTINNLGNVKTATININDLTILYGPNNCGKTNLAYSIYSFLYAIKNGWHFPFEVEDKYIDELYDYGSCDISLSELLVEFKKSINNNADSFSKKLIYYLALQNKNNISFVIDISDSDLIKYKEYAVDIRHNVGASCKILCKKEINSDIISFYLDNNNESIPNKRSIRNGLLQIIYKILADVFPDVFALTGDRAGISLFSCELSSIITLQNKKNGHNIFHKIKNVEDVYDTLPYSLPIMNEIIFNNSLKHIKNNESYIQKEHNDILEYLNDIAGGCYVYDDYTGIMFIPKNSNAKLLLSETSGSVKSLAGLNFYLKHQAKKDQVLIIDDPELNLHPDKQRMLMQLITMLVNAGLKIIITTNSLIFHEFSGYLHSLLYSINTKGKLYLC